MQKIGRYCDINDSQEFKDLRYGMDFRKPKYRREVFLRFYEFHLKYNAHPGAVYYTFPYLFRELKMTQEQKYWFTFINGLSQNVVSTYLIFLKFPDLEKIDTRELSDFFRKNYTKFGWDVDRRYVKNKFEEAVECYVDLLQGRTQVDYFESLANTENVHHNFKRVWDAVINNFFLFGRLATFSYLEYLRLAGLKIDCDSLFLNDIGGSKSHRNGLCKVMGRDDLDWYKENVVTYDDEMIAWLTNEADQLLADAKAKIDPLYQEHISFFTLESTLCCYKSWHRPNRRYPNVYNDMFADRIKSAELKWGSRELFKPFWDARKEYLPKGLRVEDNPRDMGVNKVKQNHYRKTGQVIMMDEDYPCFGNELNDYIRC